MRQVLVLFLLLTSVALADEGMWLYSDPPLGLLQERYGFKPDQEWLDHLRLASVRFNNGGSGAFVSSEGLVMTNHHVAADTIQKLSSQGEDLIKTGFYAATRAEEKKAPDLELNVLVETENVTKRVKAAVKPDMTDAEAEKARRAAMSTIEQESLEETGLRSDVVTLFRGGEYHLYRYQRYTDVRLVFAPESGIAFFGGDSDNFEYPRYCLDVAFFHVYDEDGKPVKPESHLAFTTEGLKEGDLVFVSGNPGRTERLNTVAHLKFLRDTQYPHVLRVIRRLEVMLSTFGQRSIENTRRAQDELFGVQNARKAYLGGLAGLQDPALMSRKVRAEERLRDAVLDDKELREQFGDPWAEVVDSVDVATRIYPSYYLLERGRAFDSQLFGHARTLVRLALESQKPNADRLREYRESNLESLEQELFSTAPIYKDLETRKLADSLSMFLEWEGADNDLVQKVLAGKSPRERAAALVEGTRLDDPDFRRRLADGGMTALQATSDPMIELALLVEKPSRQLRDRWTDEVEGPQNTAYGNIAQAMYETGGKGLYPDATFTLRLAFGVVKGYVEEGRKLPAFTTFEGLYERAEEHENRRPYDLPERWVKARPKLDLATPFNFVSTPDITGGNSGSPVVNGDGELVGIIFDGNIQALVLDFVYSDEQARAISVDARGIVEALTKVYEAESLVEELNAQSVPDDTDLEPL